MFTSTAFGTSSSAFGVPTPAFVAPSSAFLAPSSAFGFGLYHDKDLIREIAKNCRNEKYENLKIICPDGELRLNQLIAFFVFPELGHAVEEQGDGVILLPEFTIQDVHFRIKTFFASVNNRIDQTIQVNEIQSSLFFQENSNIDKIINEEVMRDMDRTIDEAEIGIFQGTPFTLPDVVTPPPQMSPASPFNSFQCDECLQSFTKKSSLKRHINSKHKDERMYCTQCDKWIRKDNVYAHKRLHEEKQFACDQCDKMFARPGDIKLHMKTHSDLKPFQCDICDKTFLGQSLLNRHAKIHFERKFVCKECDKAFTSAVKLKRHMQSHEDKKNYQCEICKSLFNRVDNLKKHMKKMHNVELPDLRAAPLVVKADININNPIIQMQQPS